MWGAPDLGVLGSRCWVGVELSTALAAGPCLVSGVEESGEGRGTVAPPASPGSLPYTRRSSPTPHGAWAGVLRARASASPSVAGTATHFTRVSGGARHGWVAHRRLLLCWDADARRVRPSVPGAGCGLPLPGCRVLSSPCACLNFPTGAVRGTMSPPKDPIHVEWVWPFRTPMPLGCGEGWCSPTQVGAQSQAVVGHTRAPQLSTGRSVLSSEPEPEALRPFCPCLHPPWQTVARLLQTPAQLGAAHRQPPA